MAHANKGNRSYAAPALEKGLDILECLSNSRIPLTQAQIARELGRQPNELYRMLTVLERRFYVQRDAISGAYTLTLRLHELAQAHSPYDNLTRSARWYLQELAIELLQSCHLAVIHRGQLVILCREEAPTRVRLSVEVGSTIPVFESVSGRLLLAFFGEEERMDVLNRETDFGRRSKREQDEFLAELERIRAQGYDATRDEQTAGASDVAVLVGDPHSRTKAALAVPALVRDHDAFLAASLPQMWHCADQIGHAAGIAINARAPSLLATRDQQGEAASG